MLFEIVHIDADHPMIVDAETKSKAKYKNYLDWSDAFCVKGFRDYLDGLISCRKVKEV